MRIWRELIGDSLSRQGAFHISVYGGRDSGIPLEMVERMKAALAAAGSRSQIVVYPDAPHGFNADYRPSYTPAAAADAWARMLAWFAANGAA